MARSGLVRCKMGKDGKPDGSYGDNTEKALKSLILLMKKIGGAKVVATPGARFLNHVVNADKILQDRYGYTKNADIIDKAASILNSYSGAISEQDKKLFVEAARAMPAASAEAEAQAKADLAAVKSPPRQLPGNWTAVSVPGSILDAYKAATRKFDKAMEPSTVGNLLKFAVLKSNMARTSNPLRSVNLNPVSGNNFDTQATTRQQCAKFYALLNCAAEEYQSAKPSDREGCKLIPILINAIGVRSRKPTPAELKQFMIKFTEIMSQPGRVTGGDADFIAAGLNKYKRVVQGWTSGIPGVPEQMLLAGFDTGTGTQTITKNPDGSFYSTRTY